VRAGRHPSGWSPTCATSTTTSPPGRRRARARAAEPASAPAVAAIDLPPSPALSILLNGPESFAGRKLGHHPADQKVDGGPSVLYDAVAVLVSDDGAALLGAHAPALDFVRDAHAHCKFVGYGGAALALFEAAGLADQLDEGYVELDGRVRHRRGVHRDMRPGPVLGPRATGQPGVSGTVAQQGPCRHVIVALPARDEESTISACLTSIDLAATRVAAPVTISLAADSCHDDTVSIARGVPLRRARLLVIQATWGRAGAARAAAVSHALDRVEDIERCWIANTDADCRVPVDWLAVQLRYGRAAAAVAGVVTLDPWTTPRRLLAAFRRTYGVEGNRHDHVHGANLGVWADVYTAAGGWCTRTVVGEDHALWDAVREGGRPVAQTTASTVTTSARVRSRVEGGFATDLSRIVDPPHLLAHPPAA
jgi:hypothetical protein